MNKNIYLLTGKLALLLFFIVSSFRLVAQDIAVGHWRHHLPNSEVVSVTSKPGFIYAATPYGLLEYDKEYNSIRKYDKVDGLSDFGINVIQYSHQKDLLLLGYRNGTIDILQSGRFSSVIDIRQANILGSKSINAILFDGDRAYLSTGFGIVVLDLNLFVILDTWFIGPEGSMLNVYQLLKTSSHFYAATEAGLLKASIDAPNLADFQYWIPDTDLPYPQEKYTAIIKHQEFLMANLSASNGDSLYIYNGNEWSLFAPETFYDFFREKKTLKSENGTLVITSFAGLFIFDHDLSLRTERFWYLDSRVYAYDGFMDENGTLWIGDRDLGLIYQKTGQDYQSIIMEGPASANSFGLSHAGSTLWVAPGAILGGWQNTWNNQGVFLYDQKNWHQFNRTEYPEMNALRDIVQITPHPSNPQRAYAAAWHGGLAVIEKDVGLVKIYNEENSTLERRSQIEDIVRVGGSAFDHRGNLWVSNPRADRFLSVKKPNGEWMSFPHNGLIIGNETLGRIVIDNSDQKWIVMPRGGGIMVFKETSLDNNFSFDIRKLGTQEGNGSLPSNRITALAKDLDGYIWVGSNAGVVVFYSPHVALRNQSIDAQPIIQVQDGFAGRLFENETINTIFVDGSNKKWFGTTNSGAFLLSPDGRETVKHFTRSNSPLPSNNILDISVDPITGEVFFATDMGLVSYRGFATQGGRQHSDVLVFPNPVRPGYSGYIAVRGLVANARVKITDIAGNLIHDGFAEGGQYIWDGYTLQGRKPASGVYLVFSTDPEGNETMVSKIMYLK